MLPYSVFRDAKQVFHALKLLFYIMKQRFHALKYKSIVASCVMLSMCVRLSCVMPLLPEPYFQPMNMRAASAEWWSKKRL